MKVRKLSRRNRAEWVLDYYEGPRRIRKWYKSRARADAAADNLKAEHRQAGQNWVDLSPEERNDVMTIYSEARNEGIALRTIWEAYKNGKLDAAPMERRTLKQAIEETMQWRRSENLHERYLGELEKVSGEVRGRARTDVHRQAWGRGH